MVEKRKQSPPPDDPEQSKRFVETAKSASADTSGKEFVLAIARIVPKKKAKTTARTLLKR